LPKKKLRNSLVGIGVSAFTV